MDVQLTENIYQVVDGVKFPYSFKKEFASFALSYKAQSDDIFLISYPKTGGTWIETIIFGLLNNGKAFDDDMGYYLAQTPYLERFGQRVLEKMVRPASIKLHVPFDRVPYHPKAKYICVIRNPKDVCVSFYHFIREIPSEPHFNVQFNTFFEDFIYGNTSYGDYFDHIRSIWPHRDDANVLLVSYEQMKVDVTGVILKMAQFLNISVDEELLQKLLKHSSFTYMKERYDNAFNAFYAQQTDKLQASPLKLTLVRTGIVGNWSTIMSTEQSSRLDKKIADLVQDMPGLKELWMLKANSEEY